MSAPVVWPWEELARSNASSHEVLVRALDPQPGERWLDVGTGAGATALRAAAAGAVVTGTDVAEEAVRAAQRSAREQGVEATFQVADVQDLPFDDEAFDIVASAFGANFAADHARAAGELARVCRVGGRIGLTVMPRDSRTGEFFTLLRSYGADGDHPGSWGERAHQLLGRWFELEVRRAESPVEDEEPPEKTWDELAQSFDPLRDLLARLDEDEAGNLRERFLTMRRRFEGRPRSYWLILGTRVPA